ncbi:hypothetical protein [Chryseobacterium sp. CFBP8996]|uniref:hypothetical protein n=1 Tax=Chryseobacterium sp. CFBP8996 TaxID=3096529 RepID=UPI002A6AC146|nr:hypothetical protein [Chryseobacterium sp. CFBP8996]MDY0930733.1 hypothetical protein [Chryseobacterium sp. CFBP8996]
MKLLNIDFENCFGIGKFKHEFDFEESNSYIIYAPNGTMKTSFAKTMQMISTNEKPKDLVYTKKSKYQILTDGNDIARNSILIINAEDNTFDATNRISSFIASKELKERYESVYEALNVAKAELLKKLKAISKSNDCEGEYIGSFRESTNENFLDILQKHVKDFKDEINKITFRYNDVFDTKGNVKKFLIKHDGLLDEYVTNYNNIISNSRLFKLTSDNSFGTYQANVIMKSIEDNSYFDAGHTFVLEDGTKIQNSKELETLYQEELDKILADETLKKSFDKVDKAIGANVELRAFKKVVEEDNSLLVHLKNYDEFKQKAWTSYLSEIKDDAEALSELYELKKKELEVILNEAKKEVALWKSITDKFNARFYVPFEVTIGNQQDIILKQETAYLEFSYKDKNEVSIKQTKDNLLNILSKGEQRAYFILQFLFEIESRKQLEETSLLIFDDIADSFDYKNKYAIIEYISELHSSHNFKLLILTHNFDFYRTLSSRLDLSKHSYMTTKDQNRKINLVPGLYTGTIFKEYLKRPHDPKVFISLIAFVRNLIEYSDSAKTEECKTLTNCLHQSDDAQNIKVRDVKNIFKNKISKLKNAKFDFEDDISIQDFIFSVTETIIQEQAINEILLENKIILAMACRLKMEKYLIAKLPGFVLNIYHQTRSLSNDYKLKFPTSKNLILIDKVNLMTPENIHLNSFMYEPLIDMSVFHLIDLYKEITKMN